MKTLLAILIFSVVGYSQCDTVNQIGFVNYNIKEQPVQDSSICLSGYDSLNVWYVVTASFVAISDKVVVHFKSNTDTYSIQGNNEQMLFLYDSTCTNVLPVQSDTWIVPFTNYTQVDYYSGIEMYEGLTIGAIYTVDVNYYIAPESVVSGDVCIGLYGVGEILSIEEHEPQKEVYNYYNYLGQIIDPNTYNSYIVKYTDGTFLKINRCTIF